MDKFLCYLYLEMFQKKDVFNNTFEYLAENNSLSTHCLIFHHLIHVSISFSQQFMKFMYHLIAIFHLMLGLFFQLFQKHLIEYDTADSAFKIRLGTRQLPRFLPKKICIFCHVSLKIIAETYCLNNIYANFWINYCKK